MNKNIIPFIAFVAGAVAGGLATWQYAKKKYEKESQEEIAEVREFYKKERERYKESLKTSEVSKEVNDNVANNPNPNISVSKEDRNAYKDTLNKVNYTNYSLGKEDTKEVESYMQEGPYLISYDDFGNIEDYEQETLRYYSDETVARDEDDEVIDDVEDRIGYECLRHFGDEFDDIIYVRNDDLKTDFEIIKDEGKYGDYATDFDDEEYDY